MTVRRWDETRGGEVLRSNGEKARSVRPVAGTVLLALACLAGMAAPLAGQIDTTRTRPDTLLFRVEGLRVQAQRPVASLGGASLVEVDVERLRLPSAPTGAEVLGKISGIHVRANSRGQAELSVRGSESRQVAVLLDGVPLTLGWDARTDLSVLPATALREVQFVRGLSTLLHGPNVLGGVVELNVAGGTTFPAASSWQASSTVDHVGGYGIAANGATPFETDGGAGAVYFGAGFRDSPGSTLPGDLSEPVETARDLRLNTDYRNLDGFAALRYRSNRGGWASFAATTHSGERGIAAELGADEPRLWRYPSVSRTILAASAGTGIRTTALGEGDLEASIGYDFGETEIDSYETRAYDVIDGRERGDDRTLSLRILGDHSIGSHGDLATAFTYANISHDESVDGEVRGFRQRLFSIASEMTLRLMESPESSLNALSLSFGGAFDRSTTPETGGLEPLSGIDDWGARLGLSALVGGGNTLLHAGVSRRGRFPSLREAYSEALDRFEPNPDLEPEHLVAVEAGVTSRIGDGQIQVVGFRNEVSGAIRRISLPDGRRKRINSDELTSTGVEVFLTQSFRSVEAGGEVTLQAVALVDPNTDTNVRPENVPEFQGSVYLTVPLATTLSTTLEFDHTGPQFCIDPDSGEDVELDSGSRLNLVLSKIWEGDAGRRIETTLSGSNLADSAIYDSCGLPRAGRLFQLQLRVM